MTKVVIDTLRPEGRNDPEGVAQAKALISTAYGFLESELAEDGWVVGSDFTLADCAAAPALFYADWSHPMDGNAPNVAAYRQRLMERPAFKRAIDEARPYRSYFPGGAPDRD